MNTTYDAFFLPNSFRHSHTTCQQSLNKTYGSILKPKMRFFFLHLKHIVMTFSVVLGRREVRRETQMK